MCCACATPAVAERVVLGSRAGWGRVRLRLAVAGASWSSIARVVEPPSSFLFVLFCPAYPACVQILLL
eukprot:scaffold29946_cov118-Isochrysis_galbana.AAC.1